MHINVHLVEDLSVVSTPPRIEVIERSDPITENTDSQTLVYAVRFSKIVIGVDKDDFVLSPDSTGGPSDGTSPVTSVSGLGDRYFVTVSATQDGTYNIDLVSSGHGIVDAPNNPLVNTTPTGADQTYTVSTAPTDSTAPAVSSIERSNPSGATTDSQTLVYKVTFSEDVTGVDKNDFALSSGSTGEGNNGASPVTSISGSGSVYYVTVSAATDGTYNIDLVSSGHGIADTASNPLTSTTPTGADQTYTVSTAPTDSTAPAVSSIERSNPSGATTDSQTLVYKVTFSEDVTGVDKNDFALSSGSTGEGNNGASPVASISGSGSVYYVTVSAATDGTYNIDLVSSGHGIADTASNPLTSTTPTGADHTYAVSTAPTDSTAPAVSSIERSNPSGATTDSQTLVYKVTFSEDVTGVDAADFVLSSGSTGEGNNGASPVASISGSGSVYYVTVSAATDGTYNIDLVSSGHGIADTASNPLTSTTPTGADHTYAVSTAPTDSTAPAVSSIERSNPSGAATDSQTLVYKVTFSEDVTGVDAADFVLSSGSTGEGNNGASPVASISGSGSVYYVTVSAATDGTYNIDLVSSGHGIADTARQPAGQHDPHRRRPDIHRQHRPHRLVNRAVQPVRRNDQQPDAGLQGDIQRGRDRGGQE